MLVRLLKANHFYNILLVPLVGILFLIKSLQNEMSFSFSEWAIAIPFCKPLINTTTPFWGAVLINFAAVVAIGFLLLLINARFSFLKERTFLPPYLFIFIVYAFPQLHTIQPAFISGIFILIAIQCIFKSYGKEKGVSNAFDAGFFTGIAGIFYLPSLLLVIFVPLSIYTLRNKLSWHELVASFFGVVLVWLFYFTYFFVIKNPDGFYNLFLNTLNYSDHSIFSKIPVIVYLTLLVILMIMASFFILRQYSTQKISTRRYFKILAYYFVGSLLLFFVPAVSIEVLVLVTIPLTFLISNYLIFMQSRFWAEFILIGLIILSVALQFFLR